MASIKPVAHFKNMDKNHDGVISKSEAITYLGKNGHNVTTLEKNTKWFTDMDVNKNGKIEKKEFDKKL